MRRRDHTGRGEIDEWAGGRSDRRSVGRTDGRSRGPSDGRADGAARVGSRDLTGQWSS